MNDVSKSIMWADFSWNPVSGCLAGCHYCYARKIYKRFNKSFEPQFHRERLEEPCKVSRPARIFTGSASDLWGIGVPPAWRSKIWKTMRLCPQHTFIALTKQPQRIQEAEWPRLPENLWLGVTITGDEDEWRSGYLRKYKGIKFISFEPLLANPNVNFIYYDWVIIGAMTGGGRKKCIPEKRWIQGIINQASAWGIPIFLKNNLKWPKKIQEFPQVK